MRAGPKIRVLIADKHPLLRHNLIHSLQQHQDIAVIGEAADGKQALELARQTRPDVIILDAGIPQLNCVELTTRITEEYPHTKVIGLWSGKGMEKKEAMQKAGACAFLSKASRLQTLITAIRSSFSGAA